ncbi:MAG TPA: hypothetical protein PKK26_15265, partial [Candidatus Wallbacteria bacterium]|nr:hypothetical protein [Candidatus Wallbacteria bacterium]
VYCYTAIYGYFFCHAYSWPWIVPALVGLYFAYSTRNHYLLLPFILIFQNGVFNIYIDALNANAASASFKFTAAARHIPLTFAWIPVIAMFHKFCGRVSFSNVYLVAAIIETAHYIFLLNLEPGPGSALYIFAMFAAAFLIYYFIPVRGGVSDQSLPAAASVSPISISCQVFLSLAMLTLMASMLFTSSVSMKNHEFDCAGATLYYDDLLGYMAIFRVPAEAIVIPGGDEARRKYADMKYVRVSADGGWHIIDPKNGRSGEGLIASVTGSSMAGGQAVIHVVYPFSVAMISEGEAARISTRFSYKLSVGVRTDGWSFMRGYELSGDRFLMFDDDSQYNKFQSEVKNFAAISNDMRFAAVYDYSGNIRVFNTSDAKMEMIVNDIRSMRSVVPCSADEFLVLTEKSLFRLTPKSKKIIELPAAKAGEAVSNVDVSVSTNELALILRKDGGTVLNISTLFGWNINQPEGGGVSVSYFDGVLCLWSRFFSNDLLAAEYVYGTSELSLVREVSLPAGAHEITKASGAAGTGKKMIAAAVYSERTDAFKLLEFDPLTLVPGKVSDFYCESGKQLLAFDVSPSREREIAALYADGELIYLKTGWLYNERSSLELASEFKNVFRAPSPAWVKYLDDKIFVMYDNVLYARDRYRAGALKAFQCAK